MSKVCDDSILTTESCNGRTIFDSACTIRFIDDVKYLIGRLLLQVTTIGPDHRLHQHSTHELEFAGMAFCKERKNEGHPPPKTHKMQSKTDVHKDI